MILVILGVCIVLILVGMKLGRGYDLASDVGNVMTVIFSITSGITMLVIVGLLVSTANVSTINERLAMYQEENAKIEQQIDILVKDYQEYERGVFADTTVDSAITLVSLYPELKADQLVSSQLDIYVKNNEQIKQLKLEQINSDVVRWWLYFGGK